MRKMLALGICLFAMVWASAMAGDVGHASWPGKVRAFHFVLRAVPLERAFWMIDQAHEAGFNTVVVLVTDGVNLEHAPWRSRTDAWSRGEFRDFVNYAREKGMRVVPEIKLLTHQEKFFQENRPEIMFNKSTYDPRNEVMYEQVFRLIDEIIDIAGSRAVHIGHDEVAGHSDGSAKKWLRAGEEVLPADLFLQDVVKVYRYLTQAGIETWMWGDMLSSPDEYRSLRLKSLHGTRPGYGRELRNRLPRDIVICDWRYIDVSREFPTAATFLSDGFRVIGATFKRFETTRNLSRYLARSGGDGMIATTWFHVQRKEWDVVERILRESGEAFKEFPDAQ